MAQQRSASAALDYVAALAPGVKANCWSLAESAGHEGQCRMQGLLGSYRWDWKDLRDQLPALAVAWIPDAEQDLIGPGIAIDETAQLKKGDATACVAPQHAGCTGKVENCVTTVFSAITPIRLSIAETARLTTLAAHYTAGLITRARLAFALRWSLRDDGTRPRPAGTTTVPGS